MKVHTWADSFGNWHARVDVKGIADFGEMQKAARDAIASQILQRQAVAHVSGMTAGCVSSTSADGTLSREYVECWEEPDAIWRSHVAQR